MSITSPLEHQLEAVRRERDNLVLAVRAMAYKTHLGYGLSDTIHTRNAVVDSDSVSQALDALQAMVDREVGIRDENDAVKAELRALLEEKRVVQNYFGVRAPRPGSDQQ